MRSSLSPRETSGHASPSLSHTERLRAVRSSWQRHATAAEAGDDEPRTRPSSAALPSPRGTSIHTSASLSHAGRVRTSRRSEEYMRRWAPPPSPSPSPSPRRRFVPNKNSPTWKALQKRWENRGATNRFEEPREKSRSEISVAPQKKYSPATSSVRSSTVRAFEDDSDDKENETQTYDERAIQELVAAKGPSAIKISPDSKLSARFAGGDDGSKPEEPKTAKRLPLESFVDRGADRATPDVHRPLGGASSVVSNASGRSHKSHKSSKSHGKAPSLACPSSDSTSSSLMYSLGDTVRSSESAMDVPPRTSLLPPGASLLGSVSERIPTSSHVVLQVVTSHASSETSGYDGSALRLPGRLAEVKGDGKDNNTGKDKGEDDTDGKAPQLASRSERYSNEERSNNDEEEENDGDGEEKKSDPAADLVASTLAECRLLLDMSPPPTPVSGGYYRKFQSGAKTEPPRKQLRKQWQRSPQTTTQSHSPPSKASEMRGLRTLAQDQPKEKIDVQVAEDVTEKKKEESDFLYNEEPPLTFEPVNSPQHPAEKFSPPKPGYSYTNADGHNDSVLLEHPPEPPRSLPEPQPIAPQSQPSPVVSVAPDVRDGSLARADGIARGAGSTLGGGSTVAGGSTLSDSYVAGFLTCPACSREFSDSSKGREPLHSLACDHVVCRDCALGDGDDCDDRVADDTDAGGKGRRKCPVCDAPGAFDQHRPVVSRAYLGLARRVQAEAMSAASASAAPTAEGRAKEPMGTATADATGATTTAVPGLICVPSPTSTSGRPRDDVSFLASGSVFGGGSVATPAPVERSRMESTPEQPPPGSIITPTSRAERRHRERQAKLAQSLERVNRILELSRKARDKRGADDDEPLDDRRESLTHGSTKPSAGEDDVARGKEKSGEKEDEEGGDRDGVRVRPRTKLRVDTGRGESSATESDEARRSDMKDVGVEEDDEDASKVSSRGANGEDATSAALPSPAVSVREFEGLSQNDEWNLSAPQGGSGAGVVADIFRIDGMSSSFGRDRNRTGDEWDSAQPIQFDVDFGAHMIAVSSSSGDGSSLATRDDTISLLAENRSRPRAQSYASAGGTRSKMKDYRVQIKGASSEKKRRPGPGASGDDDPLMQRQLQQHPCPQFLPSLTYSTMQESNEFVGLVPPDDEPQRSPVWGQQRRRNDLMTGATGAGVGSVGRRPKGRTIRGSGIGGSPGFFGQLTRSFDEAFRSSTSGGDRGGRFGTLESPREQRQGERLQQRRRNQSSAGSKFCREGDMAAPPSPAVGPQKEADERSGWGPTHEFSDHSCSASPASSSFGGRDVVGGGGGALDGSLVTHRPRGGRLRRKIMKRFRIKGRKSSFARM